MEWNLEKILIALGSSGLVGLTYQFVMAYRKSKVKEKLDQRDRVIDGLVRTNTEALRLLEDSRKENQFLRDENRSLREEWGKHQ